MSDVTIYGQFQGVDVSTEDQVLRAWEQLMQYPQEGDNWKVTDRWVSEGYKKRLKALPYACDMPLYGVIAAMAIVAFAGIALVASLRVALLAERRFTILGVGGGAIVLDVLITTSSMKTAAANRRAMEEEGHQAIKTHLELIENLVAKKPFKIDFLKLLKEQGLVEEIRERRGRGCDVRLVSTGKYQVADEFGFLAGGVGLNASEDSKDKVGNMHEWVLKALQSQNP